MILFEEFKTEDWFKIKDAVEPFAFVKSVKTLLAGISTTAIEN